MSKITAYSHYHPEALSMVGSPINQSVLLYVICRYQEKIRDGRKSRLFSISANKIAAEKNISWRSVKQSLELFMQRDIIEIEGSNCYFNETTYWEYLHKFQSLPYAERAVFASQFANPKVSNDEFDKFSLPESDSADGFADIKGFDVMQNITNSDISQNPMQNVRTLCKMSEGSEKCHNLLRNVTTPELIDLCKMLEPYAKCQNLLKNVISVCIKLSCDISQNLTENDLKTLLEAQFNDDFDNSAVASDIFQNPTQFSPEKLVVLAALGSDIFHNGLCKMSEVVMKNVRTVYNINNKKENQNFVLAKERVEKGFEQDEPCINFQEPLTTIELTGVDHSAELSVKAKPDYPFFSVQEIDEIVNDLQVAKTSPLKLFLYNLWGYASDLTREGYEQVSDDEEQDDLSEEEFFDPDGSIITKSDYRQLLLETYEQTAADIEKGCIELDEETVSLAIPEMFPRDLLFKILEWQTAALTCQEMSVIISKSRIRNIEAEPIAEVHQPTTREEKRQAAKEGRELMRRLYAAKQDATIYSQLTSIEKIAANIIDRYFIPNPDKEDRAPFILKNGPVMVKEEWRALKGEIQQAGLKESDFLSSLLNNKGPNDGDQLILQEPLFLWAGIKAINEIYQQTSILDTISIDE